MYPSTANDIQNRTTELAQTIREALIYLVEKGPSANSIASVRTVGQVMQEALTAVELAVGGHAAVERISAILRIHSREAMQGNHIDRAQALSTLDDYDAALAQAWRPAPSVKLVIWDLDDTFWRGTLAEGDALEIPPAHIDMVRTLTERGIVNAICSKNDFAAAQARLEQAGIWDHFVFPRIAFAPKGELIRDLIEQAQLRAENVLFIDDNALNLEEARFYNPGIQTLDAAQLDKLLDMPGLVGKPDGGKRLEQYKLLEQRVRARSSASSNEAFLRQSDIRVRITPTQAGDAERIHDMLSRTNQLNFTKKRLTLSEVRALIGDVSCSCGTVAVRDRFGDHGVIGWYCLRDGVLEHFLFSCRIINLGIEQRVYQHLQRPRLDVVGEVASSPFESDTALDYITLETDTALAHSAAAETVPLESLPKLKIYASGACDMYYIVGSLANALTDLTFECNTFRGDARGVNVSTEYLRSCVEMSDDEKSFCARHFHNYTGQTAFKTQVFDGGYDYALFSFNDDAELFIHQRKGNPRLRVVLSESANYSVTPITAPQNQDPDAWLCEHFDCLGLISPERFRENLLWLAQRIPASTRILLMTLPEFNYFRQALPTFPQYRRQCMRLNKVIRDLCAHDPRFVLVEMNRHITDRSHFTDYVMHLRPERGFRIACDVLQAMAAHPVSARLTSQLPTDGRKIALLAKGLEALPYLSTLTAAGVKVSVIGCEQTHTLKDSGVQCNVLCLSEMAGKAHEFYTIVTPQMAKDQSVLQNLGYTPAVDSLVLPEAVFNLDWRER
ncbi:MAG: HAD family hydrolase [Aquabacterium sp.]